MRVLFAGTPEAAVPALDALVASRHEVLAVLTRPPAPAGRGRHLTPSPVAEAAAEAGIEEVWEYARPRDPSSWPGSLSWLPTSPRSSPTAV